MSSVRRELTISALASLVLVCAVRAQTPAIPEDVRANLRARVENGYTVGVVVGVVDSTGPHYFAFGRPARAAAGTVDENTVFEIGSVTKVFTALLLADMAVRGEVGLDDPVQRYLPDSVRAPRLDTAQITLRLLASQRSGLPRMPGNFAPADPKNPYADYDAPRLYAFLNGYQLTRAPGARYEYSNLGFGLLGLALARRAGASYEALLASRIWDALGLASTRITLTPPLAARLARGHDGDIEVQGWDMGALAGAGAIRSSATDLLTFVAAEAGLMHTRLDSAMRLTQVPQAEVGASLKIALAWHILTRDSVTAVWHNGQTGGYHSFVGFDRARRVGVVVLTNSATSVDDIGFHVLNPRAPLLQIRTVVPLDSSVLERYVGRYELNPGFVLAVTRQGAALSVQATGQAQVRLYPASDTEFVMHVVEARITFVRDVNGIVESLVLHQNGRDITAVRMR